MTTEVQRHEKNRIAVLIVDCAGMALRFAEARLSITGGFQSMISKSLMSNSQFSVPLW
jgi:hypothetical protein